MIRFLDITGLPPYYHLKRHIILSALKEQDGPEENLTAITHHLREAGKALEVAKRTYIHDPDDAAQLETLTEDLQEEWDEYHRYKRAVLSDSDTD